MDTILFDGAKKYEWIINHQIHEVADLDIKTFLERVEDVVALRAQWTKKFSFYPTSKEEYNNNVNLWKYANGKRNALNDYHYVFAVSIPKPLYHFLRHSKRSQIFRPVILSLACLYAYDEKSRNLMEDQLYSQIWEKAVQVSKKYFSEYINYPAITDRELEEDLEVNYNQRKKQTYKDTLDKAIKDYVGTTSLFPFIDASQKHLRDDFVKTESNNFDISCPYAYMTKSDWNTIIVHGGLDDMMRVESKKEPFEAWKNGLNKFHKGVLAF